VGEVPHEDDGLRSMYFSEKLIIDTYRNAGTSAFTSADGIADKIVTAAFSVGTAYVAVIALVSPKDSVSPLLVTVPFVLLAIALGCALRAQSFQLQLEPPTNSVTVISSRVAATIKSKRKWGTGALIALILGLVIAGWAVYETYGPGADEQDSTITAQIWLTPAGMELVTTACGKVDDPLVGNVDEAKALSSGSVTVAVTTETCKQGGGTLVLPRRAIAVAKTAAG